MKKKLKNYFLFVYEKDEVLSDAEMIQIKRILGDIAIKVKNNNRDFLKTKLEKNNIQTGIHYYPNHLLKFYSNYPLPKTELIYPTLLTLPLHPDLKKADINYICKVIKSFF